jgi:drug/metabolite transporter (DMT)-like permease
MSALAGGIAFASAVCFAGSTSLQHRAAQEAPRQTSGALGLVGHLLRRPGWLVGQALAIIGLVLHALALGIGTIAVVQPIVISGVVLAVPVRSALSHRWPWPRELVGVAVTAAGLTVFLLAASPSGGTDAPAQGPALAVCAVGVVLTVAAIVVARLVTDPTAGAFLLGIGCGVLFGLVAGLMKSVLHEATHDGLSALLASWTTWALILLGGTAVVTNQYAYRLARLSASMPVLNVVDGVVAVLFGVLAFSEVLRHSPALLSVEVLAFAAISAGLFVVARLEEQQPLALADGLTLDDGTR